MIYNLDTYAGDSHIEIKPAGMQGGLHVLAERSNSFGTKHGFSPVSNDVMHDDITGFAMRYNATSNTRDIQIQHKGSSVGSERANALGTVGTDLTTMTGLLRERFIAPINTKDLDVLKDSVTMMDSVYPHMDEIKFGVMSLEGASMRDGSIAGNHEHNARETDYQIEYKASERGYFANQCSVSLLDAIRKDIAGMGLNDFDTKMAAAQRLYEVGLRDAMLYGLSSRRNDGGLMGLRADQQLTADASSINKVNGLAGMDHSEFMNFTRTFILDFITETSNAILPDTFLIPQEQYNKLLGIIMDGIALPSAPSGFATRLAWLEHQLIAQTGNPNAKVKGCFALNKSENAKVLGTGVEKYFLYNKSGVMFDNPIPFTTLVNYQVGAKSTALNYCQMGNMIVPNPHFMKVMTNPSA